MRRQCNAGRRRSLDDTDREFHTWIVVNVVVDVVADACDVLTFVKILARNCGAEAVVAALAETWQRGQSEKWSLP